MKTLVNYALSFVGVPYKWGGSTPQEGYDCCLAGSTLVVTPQGVKAIRDFNPEDQVLSFRDGKVSPEKVIKVHRNGVKPVLKIKTTASTICATQNHRFLKVKQADNPSSLGWEVRKGRKLDWEYAENLRTGDIVVMARKLRKERTVHYSKEEIRFFGAMLGDGCITEKGYNLCFVSERKRKKVQEFLSYARTGLGFSNNMTFHETHGMMFFCAKTKRKLIDMGMGARSSERDLPGWVYQLDNDQLKDFMYGYITADGSRFERDNGERGFTLSSSSEQLLRHLHGLLLSRGYLIQNIKRTIRKKPIFIKGKEVKNAKDLWTISINDNTIKDFPARNIGPNPYKDFGVSEEYTFHCITGVEYSHKEETFDLTIENSHSYFANGFVVHNSGFLQEILASVGLDPPGDQTADNLFSWFLRKGYDVPGPQAGALAFYSRDPVAHCGFCIDHYRMVEATPAYVRVRPVYGKYRDVPITLLMPRYMDE